MSTGAADDMKPPAQMEAIVVSKIDGKPGQVWHPAEVKTIPTPKPSGNEVLVKLSAAAFNHRDVFIRQSLYPGVQFDSVMGSDGVGTLVEPSSHPLHGKLVLIAPGVNWNDSPTGPDVSGKQYGILGAQKSSGGRGTFAEYICVDSADVTECPAHLADNTDKAKIAQAAAVPLGGLTAYRAVFTKGHCSSGQNVLITGIGGGVALQALQFAVAAGAKVWVTSGSEDKLEKAKKLGATGGVSYKDAEWPKKLATMLPKDRPVLDLIIDSAGGPIITQCLRILKPGAIVACYGQTTGKAIDVSIGAVLQNIELRTSTMGSRKEFLEMVAFVAKHKIQPVVETSLDGLGKAEDGFQLMKSGGQFGKIVIVIKSSSASGGKL